MSLKYFQMETVVVAVVVVEESFSNEWFHLVRCIPQNEMVALAGDTNGHVGSIGYDGSHDGFGTEIVMQMDPGS